MGLLPQAGPMLYRSWTPPDSHGLLKYHDYEPILPLRSFQFSTEDTPSLILGFMAQLFKTVI